MTLSTISLKKQNMKFAAAHFTIFSATERERLHGHNYFVACDLTTRVKEGGLSFDYRYYKTKLRDLCLRFHHTTLLPAHSPHLQLEEQGDYIYALFNGERIPFLKTDVTIVPVCNITIEELSRWMVDQMIEDRATLDLHQIEKIDIRVFSAPGQSGSCSWVKS